MREIIDIKGQSLAQKRFDLVRFTDMIESGYSAQRREQHDRPKQSFSPSNIGYGSGTCPRRWFYDFSGGTVREDNSDTLGIANMAYGTEAHERLQKVFEDGGVLVEKEKVVESEDPPIFGFADLIINWDNEETVGEIKTTSQESFVSKKAKSQPAGYHLLQVLIYMKVLGLDKGFLLYENKNSQQLLVIPVVWNVANKELADRTFEWMTKVYKNFEAGTLPKRPFHSNRSPACKSCYFNKMCWEDADGEVEIEQLEVPK